VSGILENSKKKFPRNSPELNFVSGPLAASLADPAALSVLLQARNARAVTVAAVSIASCVRSAILPFRLWLIEYT
jgi:hypothetical protein